MPTSSPSPIEEQPVEALDAIALEIDNARDLLNLALTCRSLHALVYFRHLRFRVISGRLGDWRLVDVWDLIARDKTLGRSVRVLDLHPLAYTDPRFIIPLDANRVKRREFKLSKKERAALVKRSPYEIISDVVHHLVPALANMTRLLSFSWREDGPGGMFIVRGALDPLSMLPKLWEGVNGCSNLDQLSICLGPRLDNSFFRMVHMEHVTEFSWKVEGLQELPSFREFLCRGLPNLKKLEIRIINTSFDPLAWPSALEHCNWPQLRVVKLRSRSGGTREHVENFFIRHPNIEELTYDLDLETFGDGVQGQLFLPRLRVLRTSVHYIGDLLPKVSSTVLDTLEIEHHHWGEVESSTMPTVASALRDYRSQSIAHLCFDPIVAIGGNYDPVVAELPNLKSVNEVPYIGDVALLVNGLRAKAGLNDDSEDDDLLMSVPLDED